MLVLRGYLDCRFGFVLASVCGGALSAFALLDESREKTRREGVRPCARRSFVRGTVVCVWTDVFGPRAVLFFVRAVACACLCVLFVRARWAAGPARPRYDTCGPHESTR